MAVLLVDIGNSRIKWARDRHGRVGRQRAELHHDLTVRDYQQRVIGNGSAPPSRIVVASVAGARTDARFRAAARALGIEPEFVAAARRVAGVESGYLEPWRLGVDRLLAVAGAHREFPQSAVLVAALGTALTLDLVSAAGRHCGGAIVPGPRLMVDSLLTRTSGIRQRSRGGPSGAQGLFGRSTRAAIVHGARYAAAGLIDRAAAEARRRLQRPVRVVLTGGDVSWIRPLLESPNAVIPDLVLRGLSVFANEERTRRDG